ncbi:unnamed protein product [Rotaria socialis]|uniref:Multiple myeloma tumor-associated protein 2-like N-terminal domain-containing protein n=1 Tax=Rotaria socialis TaxID=392032 RepID=A0A818KQG8_9BILA|nr:unnamed protein product [Rotaria socialis]CAF4437687.1 unnamed protein product [Rotaria socialis]
MSASHSHQGGARGGKDQFNWNSVKSDKDRECYLGHSVMAPTGRWQEGKDLTWYAKNREQEQQIKSAEFRAAKKIEEDALMTALGIKVMPPPPPPPPPSTFSTSTQHKSSIKRETTSIKNEPMTPSIHNDSRDLKQHHHGIGHDNQRKEDRRRRRQLKATGSDEEKHDWSDNDEEDLEDNEDGDKTKQSLQQNVMTEKELDDFLIDLVKKHGFKTLKRTFKTKKDKKEHKHQHSSSSSSDSEPDSKRKHKKTHRRKEEKAESKKRHRTQSSSPSASSKTGSSKHDRNR